MGILVDYLAAHGYVERAADPTDGRARLVRLTASGREIYAIAVRLVTDLERTWTDYLGDAKMRQLKRLLAELWAEIQNHAASEE